jgi:hypothetical protein
LCWLNSLLVNYCDDRRSRISSNPPYLLVARSSSVLLFKGGLDDLGG